MTVSRASAIAKTRNFIDLGSKMCRLGGKAHLTGHASPVSAGVGGGGKVLREGHQGNVPIARTAHASEFLT